jgi:ubiquitin C-terminal hydrolase
LVLSLPDDQSNNKNEGSDVDTADAKKAKNKRDAIGLIDCVKSLRNTGRFTGDNRFDCETCKNKKDATWNVTLQKRPQSLLISFRRTLWTPEKGIHKDSRQVSFPLELDASEILDIGKEKSPDDDFESAHYNLTSIVSHSGSTPFVGHYIAYARNEEKWFLFNDSSVTSVRESEVLEAEAFILLYERRGIPVA